MFFPRRLVLASIFIACCLATCAFGRPTLPKEEVDALRSIGKTLGKRSWNFSVDPCSGDLSWLGRENLKGYDNNNVTCNCSFLENTTCHVTNIRLKSQNLSGTLPPELVRLPFLQEIDLSRNYLSGTIPPGWGSMQLINISLLGNRLTGSIPKQLANISTLISLVLEENLLSGTLPPALANLSNIERMHLCSNKFSGKLPAEFAKLTTMKDFRIADSNFTGNIPDFIFQNWTKLEKLFIQASGLSGPIPAIVGFQNLSDLRISDLSGDETTSLEISNLPKLTRLILRSCNLIGPLPESLGALTTLKILDLSFNRLSGEILSSSTLSSIDDLDQLFLNANSFTGEIPRWILESKYDMDLSYNNFTSNVPDCKQKRVNLFASTSRINNSGTVSCLRSRGCPEEPLQYLYINCGGKQETVNGIIYDADYASAGPSTFFPSTTWAISSTGVFLDDDRPDEFVLGISNNAQLAESDRQLYSNARLAPTSLTYHAFCLRKNRTYNVSLHFAEIQFTNDSTFSSLGRRIFDVYIQGRRNLTDFNIEDEAGGVGKPILKNFTVPVTDGALEIRLQWAGKGSTSIPSRGVYGPLISAISIVDTDYKPPQKGGISASMVIGIVAGVAIATFLILGILWWNDCLRKKSTLERDLKGIQLQTTSFTLRQIKAATNNFDAANKIGEGGFGPVYKGILADGTVIAVKQLSAKSKQGNREFVTEIGMISALQHPHLVKLYGCCIEGNQLLLIYEYLENNSLARALFGPEEFQLKLDWPTRRKICIGMARGLAYLHEESRLKVVHRDIKATNVLLDKDLNPKISDFGLAKLDEEENTHMSTRIAGTYGYMAPEYAMHGHLSDKADVYSFGIVALEIVSGRCNTKDRLKEDSLYLLDLYLYINYGGKEEIVNDTVYEADYAPAGPATFYQSKTWVISSTGVFLDDRPDDFVLGISNNGQVAESDRQLYSNARLAPTSLTYHAFCLRKNRTYNVSLHFAEIQFTNDSTFSSLGRRIFDVYIQGRRNLTDFNIEDEAGGVGKPILKNFTVPVTDGALEIRLQWAGKGSTSIPSRGVYGPLISAISIVDTDYKPPHKGGISTGMVVGIVAGAAVATFLILGILWWNDCLRKKSTLERVIFVKREYLKGIELQTSSFTLRQIKAAINNFDAVNKIGEGGFGPVYKGILADGTVIAVKQLSAKSKQGNREFVTEIGMISALQHPHLVKLYGCCIEGNQLLLIYEYLENNSLARALFGPEEYQLKLDWPTRRKICIGIARGLAYLHEESRLKVVHRDIKATNVLLDKDLSPKISDFVLAKLDEEDNTHMSTRIAGTYGYMAPEYAMHGHLSDKADVYSFGIVALEIVSGRCNTKDRLKEDSFYLLDLAHILKEKGSLTDLIDPRIVSDCNVEDAMVMIEVALLCTNSIAAARPSMTSVVSILEGKADVLELVKDPNLSAKESNAEAVKKLYQQIDENYDEHSQTKSMLGDGPWTSSTSGADLYPVNLTSSYWQRRDCTN